MGRIIIGNFKGPQGVQGEKGDKGDQGIQGPAGPMGQVDATTPITFDTPTTYAEPISGDAISTLFGKIKKGLSDIFAKLTTHSEGISTNATAISTLNSNLEWKSAGSAGIGGSVDISGINCREFSIFIYRYAGQIYTMHISWHHLADSARTFRTGYYTNASNYGGTSVTATTSYIKLDNFYEVGVAAESAQMYIAYR